MYLREQEQMHTFQPQTIKSRKFADVPGTLAQGTSSEEFSQNLKKKLKEKQMRIAAERRKAEMVELE